MGASFCLTKGFSMGSNCFPETHFFYFGEGRILIEISSPMQHSTVAKNKSDGDRVPLEFFQVPWLCYTLDGKEKKKFQPGSIAD